MVLEVAVAVGIPLAPTVRVAEKDRETVFCPWRRADDDPVTEAVDAKCALAGKALSRDRTNIADRQLETMACRLCAQ